MVSKTDAVLQSYLLQSLNMALGAFMQGETSYTNSFNIAIQENGFIFIPRLPCAYILDDELKILKIISENELLEALKNYGNINLEEYINISNENNIN